MKAPQYRNAHLSNLVVGSRWRVDAVAVLRLVG
jgi:hypothetical protein